MGGGFVNTITSIIAGNDGEPYVTYGLQGRIGRIAYR
jgi:hypothetical protein